MKSNNTSGVSARVKRWVSLMNVPMIAGLLVVITAQPAAASTKAITPMALCLPSNETFSTPISPAVDLLAGSIGGIIPLVVTVTVVLLALAGIVAIARKKDMSTVIQALVGVVAVPFIAVLAQIIFNALWAAANNLC